MTRSHRNEDRGGEHRWTFNGVEYPTRKLMCEARRAEYVRLLDEEGMNFTQAAHAVGVSKRTGKAWRNGRTRATGRNEKPLVDWYRSTMDKPKTLHPRYLSQEERIQIADRLRLGDSIRAIARLLGRDPGTVSREVERNRNPCISSSRCFVFSHVFFSGLGSCMHFPYFSGCAEVFLPNMRASLTRRLWPVNSRSRP
ncbi:helix-turn-helix domain-containing protein, partial [Bifidobacterium longum]|uniref:helix-turn-helix domain-containing protein n=1 Tax=Bifidobacterium longum TaxID=216816 RepID=UPI001CC7ABD1